MGADLLSHIVARRFRRWRGAIATAIVISGAGCGGPSPVTPTPSTGGQKFTVTCFPTLLVGQTLDCTAAASLIDGSVHNVNAAATTTWTSSDPTIASLELFGLLTGHAAGQVTVTASYEGQSASSAPISVQFIDTVHVDSSLGPSIAGSSVFTGLEGFYAVASADSGELSLVITDQNNTVINTTTKTVAQGGDSFTMTTTFTIPSGTTQVCQKMVLQIGTSTFVAVPSAGLMACATR